jgi:hypothetical protein
MQPPKPTSSALEHTHRPVPVPVTFNNPRQRNRLHNQALKRAQANIALRRDGVGPAVTAQNPAETDQVSGLFDVFDAATSCSRRATSPRLTVTSGGLRGDPFQAFPISTDKSVLSTVDYFLQHYAPVHISIRDENASPSGRVPLARRYFGLALENPTMFELMVALAAASHAIRLGQSHAPTKEVQVHYGKGVQALRQKLAKPSGYNDDAAVLSVMALIGIAVRPVPRRFHWLY